MIIDFHCHAGTGNRMTAPWHSQAAIERHLERARGAGIDATVVFPLHNDDYEKANAELVETINRFPGELIGFARLHAERDRGHIRDRVREAVERFEFKGIKIRGGEALPTREVFDAAEDFKLPVLVDANGKPEMAVFWAEAYPDVPMILAHLGSYANDWAAFDRMPDLLSRFPNLYADTSNVQLFDALVRVINDAGPKKLLFGSDGPVHHPGLEIHKIRLLNLPKDDEAGILGKTAARLLRL